MRAARHSQAKTRHARAGNERANSPARCWTVRIGAGSEYRPLAHRAHLAPCSYYVSAAGCVPPTLIGATVCRRCDRMREQSTRQTHPSVAPERLSRSGRV